MPSGFSSFSSAGKRCLREVLIADWAHESIDGLGADRGVAAVAGGGIRATVHHGVADFNSGWKAVNDEAARLVFEHGNQVAEGEDVGFGSVQRGGELALQAAARAWPALRCLCSE